MRPTENLVWTAVVLVLCGALIAGCNAGAAPTPAGGTPVATPPATTPIAALPTRTPAAIAITSDIRFASSMPDSTAWSEPLMDVYAPPGAGNLPLVIILPPHSFTKDDTPAAGQLAEALASGGAVAVVANWSQQDDPANEFTDAAVLETIAAQGQSVAGCAAAYAVEHASQLGADPERVVIVGDLYGANVASMIALGSPDPLPGCAATADWEATGVVAIDGDWLAAMPAWDGLGTEVPRAVAALSPWPSLGSSNRVPVELVVTGDAVSATGACPGDDAARIDARDPDGTMRMRLDAIDALADGCVDSGEAADALAAQMAIDGHTARVTRLVNTDHQSESGPGGMISSLGPADLSVLTGLIGAAGSK
jgi:hypothetical protein